MLTIAYLANQFPCAVEPYVGEEIEELRSRRVRLVAGSVRSSPDADAAGCPPDVVLQPLRFVLLMQAARLCVHRWARISDIVRRVVWAGREGPVRRLKALMHTLLGACYAVLLQDREVDHIHVHHGYFGSWIAMVAARLLEVDFSMTLHGSDLLLNATYLDVKLENCFCCFTVSEYNRRYILDHYPQIDEAKLVVSRMGVEVGDGVHQNAANEISRSEWTLLSVGRLHAVKDHAFLVRACARLHEMGVEFSCSIAGDGPERHKLEALIRKYGIEDRLTLLGHVPREQMDSLYRRADVVVLTSRSEGIPLVLMEAMARGKVVVAPAITGIPELVSAGHTGFLYASGSLDDFVSRILFIRSLMQARCKSEPHFLSANSALDWIRHAAQVQVRHNFNRKKNLQSFADSFLSRVITAQTNAQPGLPYENSLLQQIQLPVQRNGSLPVRTDGLDAVAGTRSGAVLNG
jgi:glycosyltransferase involved in cell wall biosynthesis